MARQFRREAHPCPLIKAPRREALPRIFLDPDQYRQVLHMAVRHGIFAEVAVALFTGLRRGELQRPAWTEVDFERQVVIVPTSKSRRPRQVPMSAKARALLQRQQKKTGNRKYVFPGQERRDRSGMRRLSWWVEALEPIRRAMPVFQAQPGQTKGRGWHLFRHTLASRLVQAGVPIAKVSAWLGHSDIRTTMVYAHLAPGHDEDIEKA